MQDRSYEQAKQDLIRKLSQELQDAMHSRIHFLADGVTVAEVTADIDDPMKREYVAHFLLNMTIRSLLATYQEKVGVPNARQLQEIMGYLDEMIEREDQKK